MDNPTEDTSTLHCDNTMIYLKLAATLVSHNMQMHTTCT